jgi:hypothetical protein
MFNSITLMTFPPLREKSSSYPHLLGRSGIKANTMNITPANTHLYVCLVISYLKKRILHIVQSLKIRQLNCICFCIVKMFLKF